MPFITSAAFIIIIMICGGASRGDELAQIVARSAAVAAIIALLWIKPAPSWADMARPGLIVIIITGLIAAQLIPLPPALWTALPGRELYIALPALAGFEQPWRPLNVSPDGGWNALMTMLVPLAMACCLAHLRGRFARPLLTVILLMMGISAMLGVVQITGSADRPLTWYRIFSVDSAIGFFANRNHLALLMALALPCLATWVVTRPQAMTLPVIAVGAGGALVSGIMILMIGSRAGLVTGLAGMIGSLVIVHGARRRFADMRVMPGRPLFRRALTIGAGGATVVLLAGLAIAAPRYLSITRLFDNAVAGDGRARILQPTIDLIGRYFPFGSGFGTYPVVYRQIEPFRNLSLEYINQAHNDFLQLSVEAGLPAMLLLLIAPGWILLAGIRGWRGDGARPEQAFHRLGLVALIMLAIASMVDYPLRTPAFMILAMTFASWIANGARDDTNVTGAKGLPASITAL
jgi:O-antigen ligase